MYVCMYAVSNTWEVPLLTVYICVSSAAELRPPQVDWGRCRNEEPAAITNYDGWGEAFQLTVLGCRHLTSVQGPTGRYNPQNFSGSPCFSLSKARRVKSESVTPSKVALFVFFLNEGKI